MIISPGLRFTLHRSELLTLSTMTYTGMRRSGFSLRYTLEICLVGIKSKAKA